MLLRFCDDSPPLAKFAEPPPEPAGETGYSRTVLENGLRIVTERVPETRAASSP